LEQLKMKGRTFRVFVSSTFSDLKAERNALQIWVFPKLRALCEQRGYKFQAVDLRWGVPDEAAIDQQTTHICLEEISRCRRLSPRPNFLMLLGDRYGWCPSPSSIPAGEFSALKPHLDALGARLIEQWYRLDENAVPPEWVLQPRRGELEDCAPCEGWAPVERVLRGSLLRAAERSGLDAQALRRYRASATELEIVDGALDRKKAPDAQEHVFAFFRRITNLGDVERALSATPSQAAGASQLLTEPIAARDLLDTRDGKWDREAWARVEQLKATIRERLGANVWDRYEASWNGEGLDLDKIGAPIGKPESPDEMEFPAGTLCSEVWQRLSRVMTEQMNALDSQTADSVASEREVHEAFRSDRVRGFVGRAEPLAAIARYLAAGPARPLVVHGSSGSGKSALMARAVEAARARHPNALVAQRYIGAAPGASEVSPMLRSLCMEISRGMGIDETTVPFDYATLTNEFPKRLDLATAKRPIFVFLDALDQLGAADSGRRLLWLPRELPLHSRIIVSTIPDESCQCFSELRAAAEEGDLVGVSPMSVDDAGAVLDGWLAQAVPQRTLNSEQRGYVLSRFRECGLPLFLKLAFEEARRWHSYDGVPSAGLADDLPGLIRALFRRLSQPEQHGPVLLGRAVGYLAAARFGLSDDEMLDLLWRDEDAREEFEQRNEHHALPAGIRTMPAVIWSRMYFDLEPYLTEREVFGVRLLGFYHRQLADVAAEEYLGRPDHARMHNRLADYFAERWTIPDTHALVELPEHLVNADREPEARELLLRYQWLDTKLRATDISWLLADYERFDLGRHEACGLVEGAIRLSRHVLTLHPDQLASHLRARMLDEPEPGIRTLLDQALAVSPPALVPVRSSLDAPGGVLRHSLAYAPQGTSSVLSGFALSADGGTLATSVTINQTTRLTVWDVSSGQIVRQIPGRSHVSLSANGHTLACGDDRGEITIWDVGSGKLIRKISDRGSNVRSALSADGRFLLSVTTSFKVWDVESGELLRSVDYFQDHGRRFQAFAMSRHGEAAVLVDTDRTLEVWDLVSGTTGQSRDEPRSIFRATAPEGGVIAAAVSDDGRTVVLCIGPTILTQTSYLPTQMMIWDIDAARASRMLEDEAGFANLAISADGRMAVTSSPVGAPYDSRDRRALKVWDLVDGKLAAALTGLSQPSQAVRLSADGRTAVSTDLGNLLKVWDLSPESIARTRLEARTPHEGWVGISAVAVADDGETAVVASEGTLKVWDVPSNTPAKTLRGHQNSVSAIRMSQDRRFAISCSNDKTVRVWDLQSGSLVHALEGHQMPVFGLALSRNATIAVSGSDDGTLRVWDIATGSLVRTLHGHTRWVRDVALSADGSMVVSAAFDGTLRFWELATGTAVRVIEGVTSGSGLGGGLAVSASGLVTFKRLFERDESGLEVRDLASGDLLYRMIVGPVNALAMSDDGRIVATVCARELNVWDLDSRRSLTSFYGDAFFSCVAATSDGHRIVAGDEAGRVHVFDLVTGSVKLDH
jgi:NACHT domain- and WD repeat-containing protein